MCRTTNDPAGHFSTEYAERDSALVLEQWKDLAAAQARLIDDLQLAHDTVVSVLMSERSRTHALAIALKQAAARIEVLTRKVFGRTSERQTWPPNETPGPADASDAATPRGEPSPESESNATTTPDLAVPWPEPTPSEPHEKRSRGQQAGQPGHGRTRLDRTETGLPVRHEYLEVPDEALPCPHCGAYPEWCGTEDRDLVNFRVPWELVAVQSPRR